LGASPSVHHRKYGCRAPYSFAFLAAEWVTGLGSRGGRSENDATEESHLSRNEGWGTRPLFRPVGARWFPTGTHGLRRGLHSFAASRLQPEILSRLKRRIRVFRAALEPFSLWASYAGLKARSSTVVSAVFSRSCRALLGWADEGVRPYVGCGGLALSG
jgi:hypothetical protein